MRDYEIVYIFKSALASEEIEARLERYHQHLGGDSGQVTAVEHWGKRQLAFPILGETSGTYVVAQFTADPEVLPELEKALKLDEDLLRHLIVLSEGEPPLPPSLRGEAPDDEEDEDEDEEEEEEEEEEGEDEEEDGDEDDEEED